MVNRLKARGGQDRESNNYISFIYISPFIDNYLPDYNLMIEVMGDFWHCNPCKYSEPKYDMMKKHIERDIKKHEYIKNEYGIEILYLWENDLKNNVDKCLSLIKEYIDNKGILQNYHSFNYCNDTNIDIGY